MTDHSERKEDFALYETLVSSVSRKEFMALVICYEFLAVGCSILKLLVLFLGAGLFSLVGLSDAFWLYLSVMLAWTLTSLKSTVQSIPIFSVVLHINQNAARRGRQM